MTEQPVDLHRVLVEIEDEVRAKRASGELPRDFERELDLMFARFAPAGALDGDFDQLMEHAEQQAFFDLLAPNESVRPGVPQVKRVVQKTVRWYMRYVVDQITGFSHTITQALRQLGERTKRIEELSAPADELHAAIARGGRGLGRDQIASVVATISGVNGRVLHASCGEGELVRALRDEGADAYGVDSVAELVATGSEEPSAVDLRTDSERDHLRAVAPGSLGAVVLSGCIDTLPVGAQIELIDLVAVAMQKGGRLVLLASDPESWRSQYGASARTTSHGNGDEVRLGGRTRSKIEHDLAPGHPLHMETWQYLLESRGFSEIEATPGPRLESLDHVPGGGEPAAGMNANIDRLNDLLFPPASWLIAATR